MEIRPTDWTELNEAVWRWNPIGISRVEPTDDEYTCVVEEVVPLLQRGASVEDVITHFDQFLPEHFGLPPDPGVKRFAEDAFRWWMALQASDR